MLLGIATDSQDRYGNVVEIKPVPDISADDLEEVMEKFKGDILQVPPMYSAKKVGGKKLYEFARSGLTVEREPVKVTVYDIAILNYFKPNLVKFRVRCSKGTYIRTLCNDIATSLKTCGYMLSLERVKSGVFSLKESVDVEHLREDDMLPVDYPLKDLEKIVVSESDAIKALNGGRLSASYKGEDQKVRIYSENGSFLAIGQRASGIIKVLNVFTPRR